jgi:fructose/tagatose bisphosphate aldolase
MGSNKTNIDTAKRVIDFNDQTIFVAVDIGNHHGILENIDKPVSL